MKFRFVFWDVLPCKIIALMMEAARTSETSVDNYFTLQYIPEDKSELYVKSVYLNLFGWRRAQVMKVWEPLG
jgi:hypothetical protein